MGVILLYIYANIACAKLLGATQTYLGDSNLSWIEVD